MNHIKIICLHALIIVDKHHISTYDISKLDSALYEIL
nr:MAG TPA: hypothetical protein [Bacteriophage sp.]